MNWESHSGHRWALSMFVLCALTGCLGPPKMGPDMFASADVFGAPRGANPISETPLYDSSTQTIHLAGAVNEVLGFYLRVGGSGRLNVAVQDFVSDSNHRLADNVDVFRIHHVQPPRFPGWYVKRMEPSRRPKTVPDVLVPAHAPRGGLPTEAGRSRPVELWIDVRLPKGTPPGDYESKVVVTASGKAISKLPIKLTIWPFVLPDNAGPEFVVDVDHEALFAHHVMLDGRPYHPPRVLEGSPKRRELAETITSTMRLLREHGLSPHLPKLYPVAKIDAKQNMQVDWADYDSLVSGFLDGSAYRSRSPARSWTMPFDDTFPPPPDYGSKSSPAFSRMLTDYLSKTAEHFSQRGWLDRSCARIPMVDGDPEASADNIEHYGYISRQADKRIRTLATGIPQDMGEFGWHGFRSKEGGKFVDVWAPPGQFFDKKSNGRSGEKGAWLTLDRPPFTGSIAVYSPAVDTRVIGWQAYSGRVGGVVLGVANRWPEVGSRNTSPQDCVDYDPGVLLYPGSSFGLSEPVASLRLKRLRRSAQDGLYLHLLEKFRGKEHIARTVLESLLYRFGTASYGAHFADGTRHPWCENPYAWEAARNICAKEILATGDEQGGIEGAVQWQQFMQAVRQVRFDVRGVRVQRSVGQDQLEIDTVIQVTNDSRVPIEGFIRVENPPVGWKFANQQTTVKAVRPGKSRSAVITATAPTITWGDAGVQYLTVLFEAEGSDPVRVPVRMCHVAAPPLAGPITLDGDLTDWPESVGNDAGSFVLISGRGAKARSFATAGPTHDTTCMTGIQDGKLLLGIRCAFDPSNRRVIGESSARSPEDLVPTGEDAVEILIDPTNAGTRSTGDLYHIVVRSGGVEWEHGVTLNPPTGPVRHWPTKIEHAARILDDAWVAEVAIPLDAFPESFRSAAVWGFNVARFDYAAQQYSNWAGAVGNVYDPQSLGNLTIP